MSDIHTEFRSAREPLTRDDIVRLNAKTVALESRIRDGMEHFLKEHLTSAGDIGLLLEVMAQGLGFAMSVYTDSATDNDEYVKFAITPHVKTVIDTAKVDRSAAMKATFTETTWGQWETALQAQWKELPRIEAPVTDEEIQSVLAIEAACNASSEGVRP